MVYYSPWCVCVHAVLAEGCDSDEPICDYNNVQHASLCSFLTTQGEINYFGYCEVSVEQLMYKI